MPRHLSLAVLAICAASLLAGCQLTGAKVPAGPGNDVTANAVMGSEIEVTALDAPPGDAPASPDAAAKPAGPDTAAPQEAPAADATAETAATEVASTPAPKPDLAETPVTPKSEMQLACEKKGGNWSKIGKGEARACVRRTKDGGKRCERESQCDGVCLARSGTCSPFKPLYGCNEILQDNGARVTLCLE